MAGNVALSLQDRPVVFTYPIQAHQFNTIEELKTLADKQNLPIIFVTKEAWHKYESLLFTPDELDKIMEKK